jgi:hypothetical protein
MNLQYADPKEAADFINIVNAELTDFDIKGALINALERIARLENQVAAILPAAPQGERETEKKGAL